MRNNKFVNALAIVGALIILLGVTSAANQAFAAEAGTSLNSGVPTSISGL